MSTELFTPAELAYGAASDAAADALASAKARAEMARDIHRVVAVERLEAARLAVDEARDAVYEVEVAYARAIARAEAEWKAAEDEAVRLLGGAS